MIWILLFALAVALALLAFTGFCYIIGWIFAQLLRKFLPDRSD